MRESRRRRPTPIMPDSTPMVLRKIAYDAGAAVRAFAAGKSGKPDYTERALSTGEERSALKLPEYNPDVLYRKAGSFKVYDDMMRDETVRGVLKGTVTTRLGSGLSFTPGDESDAAKRMCDEFEHLLQRMPGTFERRLEKMMSALWYGVSVSEVVPEIIQTPFGERVGIRKIAARKIHSFGFDTDDFGNLKPDGLIQYTTSHPMGKRLDTAQFIIYSHDAQWDSPWGTSMLNAVHRSWWSKDWVIKFWNQALETFAGGIFVVQAGENADADKEAEVRAAIEGLRANSAIIMPSGYVLDIKELAAQGLSAFDTALKTHNALIASGLLFPNRLGFVDFEGGSYNLAETHMALWTAILDDIGQEVCEHVIREQLFGMLKRWNGWPDSVPAPIPTFDPISDKQRAAFGTQIIESVKAGVLRWSEEDEKFYRAMFGLPEAVVAEVVTEPESNPEVESEERQGVGGAETPGNTSGAPVEPDADRPLAQFAVSKKERRLANLALLDGKCDFAAIERGWDSLDEAGGAAIAEVMRRMRDATLEFVERSGIVERQDYNAATDIKLKFDAELRKAIEAYVLASYLRGKTDAMQENSNTVRKLGIRTRQTFAANVPWVEMVKLIPEAAMQWISTLVPIAKKELGRVTARAFFVSGVESARIANEVKTIVLRGLEKQDVWWTKAELNKAFNRYIDTGAMVIPGPGEEGYVPAGARAEAVARTQFAEAYNMGRVSGFEHPDVAPLIEGYMWVSVLDEHTTDYCEALDGQVFPKDEFEPPPAHMNCRSIIVAMFAGEEFQFAEGRFPVEGRGRGFSVAAKGAPENGGGA